uniref:Uncharacterized protein n=1 Tax=Glossina brevipalpis TaxID=37001 RepID=A0A1A9WGY5_9MUSC
MATYCHRLIPWSECYNIGRIKDLFQIDQKLFCSFRSGANRAGTEVTNLDEYYLVDAAIVRRMFSQLEFFSHIGLCVISHLFSVADIGLSDLHSLRQSLLLGLDLLICSHRGVDI